MRTGLVAVIALLVAAVAAQLEHQTPGNNRARFRALVAAARSGDPEARERLQSLRRRPLLNEQGAVAGKGNQPFSRPRTEAIAERPSTGIERRRLRIPVRKTPIESVPEPKVKEATTLLSTASTELVELATPATTTQVTIIEQGAAKPMTQSSSPNADAVEEIEVPRELVKEEVKAKGSFAGEEPELKIAQIFEKAKQKIKLTPLKATPVLSSRPIDAAELHKALNPGLEVRSKAERKDPAEARANKTNVIGTTRRYSYFDEEGNYVFGYEGADGSFKEEKRGRDCVVNGKYGYIDPDGVRREYTYITGNRCHPNIDPTVDPELIPRNKQFLEQSRQQKLSDAELSKFVFNRRRRPVSTDGEPAARKGTVTILKRPINKEVPQEIVETSSHRFTTPASFTKFTTSSPVIPTVSIGEPVTNEVISVVLPERVRQSPRVPSTISLSPKPSPVAFNFENEFNRIFQNFASAVATTQAPSIFRPVTIKSTTPLSITTFAPATTTTPKPLTTTTRSSLASQDSFFTLGGRNFGGSRVSSSANFLVFDAKTGTFKNVRGESQQSLAHPTSARAPATTPRPVIRPTTSSTRSTTTSTGRPLIPRTGLNPLPPIPLGPLLFNEAGQHKSAAEFDRFFTQFRIV